ncbi:hypothetical protein B5M42_023235 [Paenibacillus athensensis]|uniref:Uncharacterized protein n=1 Tax=Paenibacillus athensensis TaxID=1967502 RepID=A0A4Y8PV53_9BACL|nr:hypothetical protein [Paenibacillus athensensis]
MAVTLALLAALCAGCGAGQPQAGATFAEGATAYAAASGIAPVASAGAATSGGAPVARVGAATSGGAPEASAGAAMGGGAPVANAGGAASGGEPGASAGGAPVANAGAAASGGEPEARVGGAASGVAPEARVGAAASPSASPAAPAHAASAAPSNEINWDQFFDNDLQTTPSSRFWDLSGHNVQIKGFMGEVLSFEKHWFLLIPSPGAECPFDNGDETYWNKIMIVYVPDDIKLRYTSGPLLIKGRLDVGIKLDESGYKTMFRLYDASFERIKE